MKNQNRFALRLLNSASWLLVAACALVALAFTAPDAGAQATTPECSGGQLVDRVDGSTTCLADQAACTAKFGVMKGDECLVPATPADCVALNAQSNDPRVGNYLRASMSGAQRCIPQVTCWNAGTVAPTDNVSGFCREPSTDCVASAAAGEGSLLLRGICVDEARCVEAYGIPNNGHCTRPESYADCARLSALSNDPSVGPIYQSESGPWSGRCVHPAGNADCLDMSLNGGRVAPIFTVPLSSARATSNVTPIFTGPLSSAQVPSNGGIFANTDYGATVTATAATRLSYTGMCRIARSDTDCELAHPTHPRLGYDGLSCRRLAPHECETGKLALPADSVDRLLCVTKDRCVSLGYIPEESGGQCRRPAGHGECHRLHSGPITPQAVSWNLPTDPEEFNAVLYWRSQRSQENQGSQRLGQLSVTAGGATVVVNDGPNGSILPEVQVSRIYYDGSVCRLPLNAEECRDSSEATGRGMPLYNETVGGCVSLTNDPGSAAADAECAEEFGDGFGAVEGECLRLEGLVRAAPGCPDDEYRASGLFADGICLTATECLDAYLLPRADGSCRAPSSSEECSALFEDAGVTRPEHLGKIYVPGANPPCRHPAFASECQSINPAEPIYEVRPGDPDNCRAATSNSDCEMAYGSTRRPRGFVMVNGRCALPGSSCAPAAAVPLWDNPSECVANEDACHDITRVVDGGVCRIPITHVECREINEMRPILILSAEGADRCVPAATAADCEINYPGTTRQSDGSCDASPALACLESDAAMPIPDGSNCIAATSSDQCRMHHSSLPIADGSGGCRPASGHADCRASFGDAPIRGADGRCRAAADHFECLSAFENAPIFEAGVCRAAASDEDCRIAFGGRAFGEVGRPFMSSGACVAEANSELTMADCQSEGLIFRPRGNSPAACVPPLGPTECRTQYGENSNVENGRCVESCYSGLVASGGIGRCRMTQEVCSRVGKVLHWEPNPDSSSVPVIETHQSGDMTVIIGSQTEPTTITNVFRVTELTVATGVEVVDSSYPFALATNPSCRNPHNVLECSLVLGAAYTNIHNGICVRSCPRNRVPNGQDGYHAVAGVAYGECRDQVQRDCPAGQVLTGDVNGICRAPATAAECRARVNPSYVMESGLCVQSCNDGRAPDSTGVCGAPAIAQTCRLANPLLPVLVTVAGNAQCVAATDAAACQGADPRFPIYRAGTCEAATSDEECAAAFPAMPLATADGSCQAPESAADCRKLDPLMPVFEPGATQNDPGTCAALPAESAAGAATACHAADPMHPVRTRDGTCVPATSDADCRVANPTTPILGANGCVRANIHETCFNAFGAEAPAMQADGSCGARSTAPAGSNPCGTLTLNPGSEDCVAPTTPVSAMSQSDCVQGLVLRDGSCQKPESLADCMAANDVSASNFCAIDTSLTGDDRTRAEGACNFAVGARSSSPYRAIEDGFCVTDCPSTKVRGTDGVCRHLMAADCLLEGLVIMTVSVGVGDNVLRCESPQTLSELLPVPVTTTLSSGAVTVVHMGVEVTLSGGVVEQLRVGVSTMTVENTIAVTVTAEIPQVEEVMITAVNSTVNSSVAVEVTLLHTASVSTVLTTRLTTTVETIVATGTMTVMITVADQTQRTPMYRVIENGAGAASCSGNRIAKSDENYVCRDRTLADCAAGRILSDDGSCRAPLSFAECLDAGFTVTILGIANGLCAESCGEGEIADPVSGVCRVRSASDCAALGQVLSEGNCAAPSHPSECTSIPYEGFIGIEDERCVRECSYGNFFVAGAERCLEITAEHCDDQGMVLDAGSSSCRAPMTGMECSARGRGTVIEGGECASGCRAGRLPGSDGVCNFPQGPEDCQTVFGNTRPVYRMNEVHEDVREIMREINNVMTTTLTTLTFEPVIRGGCWPRVAQLDCSNGQVVDAVSGECRAPRSTNECIDAGWARTTYALPVGTAIRVGLDGSPGDANRNMVTSTITYGAATITTGFGETSPLVFSPSHNGYITPSTVTINRGRVGGQFLVSADDETGFCTYKCAPHQAPDRRGVCRLVEPPMEGVTTTILFSDAAPTLSQADCSVDGKIAVGSGDSVVVSLRATVVNGELTTAMLTSAVTVVQEGDCREPRDEGVIVTVTVAGVETPSLSVTMFAAEQCESADSSLTVIQSGLCAEECNEGFVPDENNVCRPRQASDCAEGQVYERALGVGFCRDPLNVAGVTPLTAAECAARDMVPSASVAGGCRTPSTAGDCFALGLLPGSGTTFSCVAPSEISDCTDGGLGSAINDGRCVAECGPGQTPAVAEDEGVIGGAIMVGECRDLITEDCVSGLVARNGVCVTPRTAEECLPSLPVIERGECAAACELGKLADADNGVCRFPRTTEECISAYEGSRGPQRFNPDLAARGAITLSPFPPIISNTITLSYDTVGNCRFVSDQSECDEEGRIFVERNGNPGAGEGICRAPENAAECEAIASLGNVHNPLAGTCVNACPQDLIGTADGTCRAPTSGADCSGDSDSYGVYESELMDGRCVDGTDNCGENRRAGADNACRAWIQEDCIDSTNDDQITATRVDIGAGACMMNADFSACEAINTEGVVIEGMTLSFTAIETVGGNSVCVTECNDGRMPSLSGEATEGMCRDIVAADCNQMGMSFDSSLPERCTDPDQMACAATGRILETSADSAENGMCRAPNDQEECEENPPFGIGYVIDTSGSDHFCRERTQADCTMTGEILDTDQTCRFPNDLAECMGVTGASFIALEGGVCVDACSGGQAPTEGFCGELTQAICTTLGRVLVGSGLAARCNDPSNVGECARVFPGNPERIINAGGTCEACPSGQVAHFNVNGGNAGGVCAAPLANAGGNNARAYSASECESAGWPTSLELGSSAGQISEVCRIPVMIAADQQQPSAQQLDAGDEPNSCVLRDNYGAAAISEPDCNDPRLFGNEGLPNRPAEVSLQDPVITTVSMNLVVTYPAPARRLVVQRTVDTNNRIVMTRIFVMVGSNTVEVSRFAFPTASDDDGRFVERGLFAVAPVIGVLLYGLISEEIIYLPDFGYRSDGSGTGAWTYEGRIEYSGIDWRSYVLAGGQSGGGGLVYETGGRYDAELWAASYTTRETGGTGDYDFALSTEWRAGAWEARPNLHAGFTYDKALNVESSSGLGVDMLWSAHKWTVNPRASFAWSSETSSSSPRLRVNIERKF